MCSGATSAQQVGLSNTQADLREVEPHYHCPTGVNQATIVPTGIDTTQATLTSAV